MGHYFSKAPVTSYFILGYSIGFPLIYFAPDSIFHPLRLKLFRSFEKAEVRVDPSKRSKIYSEDKIIDHLIKISQDDSDDDKAFMRSAAVKRVRELADREEEWARRRQISGAESKEIKTMQNEYEAAKRLSAKNNKV